MSDFDMAVMGIALGWILGCTTLTLVMVWRQR